MHPGSNGPLIVNGGANNYDRAVCFDAPVSMDTGVFVDPNEKTLAQLRTDMMIGLGYAAQLASPPPGMTEELNYHLQSAQEQLYERYDSLRTERWWAWQLSAGKRFYDVPIDCTKYLNFRKITWAGLADNGGRILRGWAVDTAYSVGEYVMSPAGLDFEYEVTVAGTSGSTQPAFPTVLGGSVVTGGVTLVARSRKTVAWLPMQHGIDPLDYGSPSPGYPTHFEAREALEIWPAPTRSMTLWLRGHMGLKRFTQDTDTPTIDSRAVFLFALANAKAQRGQADAGNYAQMLNRLISGYVAGSHGARRYITRPSTLGMKCGYDDLPAGMPRATWR